MSTNPYVETTINSDQSRSIRVNLGSGQYIYETLGVRDAEGGVTSSEIEHVEPAKNYLTCTFRELKLPHFVHPVLKDLLYIHSDYNWLSIYCMEYVDRQFRSAKSKRSFLGQFFGSIDAIEWSSPEGHALREKLRLIISAYNNAGRYKRF